MVFETSIIIGIYSDILRAGVMIVIMTVVIIGSTSCFCVIYMIWNVTESPLQIAASDDDDDDDVRLIVMPNPLILTWP